MTIEDLLYQCIDVDEYPTYKIVAPQNTSVPYAVFYVVSDTKTNTADGMDASYEDVRLTINVYDEDLFELVSKRDAIIGKLNACDTFSCIMYQTIEDSPDAQEFRSIIDFKLNRVI